VSGYKGTVTACAPDRLTTLRLLVSVQRGIAMALRDTSRELVQDAAAVRAQAQLAAARSTQLCTQASRRHSSDA
jgi:hypothetical protein